MHLGVYDVIKTLKEILLKKETKNLETRESIPGFIIQEV